MQNVPGFSPWMLFGQPPLLAQCINLVLCLYYIAIWNLFYGCRNILQAIAESSNALPIHCAQHVQQPVNMSIQLLAGLQCDPIQMAEVVHQEYILISRALLYSIVNLANFCSPLKEAQLLPP